MLRWKRLTGVITRSDFTHDHAKRALNRILSGDPPCGRNNEQFRDCCIWEAALEVARDAPVHLISGDSAFYRNRNLASGLSPLLQKEAREANVNVNLHRDIATFLSTTRNTIAQLDEVEEIISQKIIQHVLPAVNDIVSKHGELGGLFAVGDHSTPEIQGFATPEPNICAVSFSTQFQLQNIGLLGEQEPNAMLTVGGTCVYNTQDKGDVAEVEIESWAVVRVEESQGRWQWRRDWRNPDRRREDLLNSRVTRA